MEARQITPKMVVAITARGLSDPGITYNEVGVTYNDSLYTYGGLYGNDITPAVNEVNSLKPKARIEVLSTIPQVTAIKPKAVAVRTGVGVSDPHITYNQSGVTYNDPSYTYGGLYGRETTPVIVQANSIKPKNLVTRNDMTVGITSIQPKATVERTGVMVSNPGITYNETGVIYNDSRYAYGGIYGKEITPAIASANLITPKIRFIGQADGTAPIPSAIPLGPGFFLFITT